MNILKYILGQLVLLAVSVKNSKRGSPLVEESVLMGLSLFVFMILAAVIFDLVEFAKSIFSGVTSGLDQIPG